MYFTCESHRREEVKGQLVVRLGVVDGGEVLLGLQRLVVRVAVLEGPRLLAPTEHVEEAGVDHPPVEAVLVEGRLDVADGVQLLLKAGFISGRSSEPTL